MAIPPTNGTSANAQGEQKTGPDNVYYLADPVIQGHVDVARNKPSGNSTAIVIDNGSSTLRAGWATDASPRLSIVPLMARYRDRKINRPMCFIGNDVYVDGSARSNIKSVYEPGSNIVNNWDVMEGLLDYVFIQMGIDGKDGRIDRPVLLTEPAANLGYSRKTMSEILFECYGARSVAYGIDALFSYKHNKGNTGLVVSSSHTSTHLIPVINSKPVLSQASRLNWGQFQSAEYLNKLLKLKYPAFPGKISDAQAEELVREHCYISQDYNAEVGKFLDWTGLEDRTRVIQHPYTEQVVVEKTAEELARQAEKRKESGRRLQEQAAKMRLEKLVQKEQELAYYKDLQQRISESTKKDARIMLEADDFDNEAQLDRKIKEMEKSIRKARNKDVGDVEEEEEKEEPTFPLLEVPDDQLDEEGLKQKRLQKLLKSNHEARQRAKAEKEREKARLAEEQRLDDERREADLDGWVAERRAARQAIVQKIKDRERLKADLGNRKSLASQMRMKSIAHLASENTTKKRRRGGDDDNFGADDADWSVYRTIATGEGSDDEEDEDLSANLKVIEEQLLKHDPGFTEESTREAQMDWTKSLVHAFTRGPWPFNPESQRELNQVHLNVERIRVPEVIFQPAIAGLDQAGIIELAQSILIQRLPDANLLRDVFLTGGNVLFRGFEERLRDELRAILPNEAPLNVRKARDPVLDAWRGAAGWAAAEAESRPYFVKRAEFLEKGGDYLLEHAYGNTNL